MATLSEYFESEARDYLAQLDRDLERPRPDPLGLQRAARALRGTAQMAREDRVLRAAGALEAAARAMVENRVRWSADVATRARETIADLRVLVERRQSAASLDAVADAAVARWRDAGIQLTSAAVKRPDVRASASREFRAYAAREVSAIAEALDRGVQQLAAAPMDREPLKMILRRQRALLGAARLQELPVVAEILRAIDDLTRVIAKLDVGVKREWLDIYRVAREGLRATIQPLQQDENPRPSHALSRLRHMREELLERYGAGEVVSAAHESEGFTQATTVERAPGAFDSRETEPAVLADAPADGTRAVAAPADADAELLLTDEVVAEVNSALDDPVIELDVADEEVLELDEAVLELDDAVLELDEAVSELDEAVLDLDNAVLELDDAVRDSEPSVDTDVLELEDAADRSTDGVVELDVARIGEAVAEAPAGQAVDGAAAVPIESLVYERDQALRRALELRDLVALSAIDPVTHEAVDELFDLIGIALR